MIHLRKNIQTMKLWSSLFFIWFYCQQLAFYQSLIIWNRVQTENDGIIDWVSPAALVRDEIASSLSSTARNQG